MAKVMGIGGVFPRCADMEATRNWYVAVLGLEPDDFGSFHLMHDESAASSGQGARTIFAPYAADTAGQRLWPARVDRRPRRPQAGTVGAAARRTRVRRRKSGLFRVVIAGKSGAAGASRRRGPSTPYFAYLCWLNRSFRVRLAHPTRDQPARMGSDTGTSEAR